jgi:hypothetical protein
MRPNAKDLALRDPAMAALVGIIPMGNEDETFGADTATFGADEDEDEDDDDWGAEFGAVTAKMVVKQPAPTAKEVAKVWSKHSQGATLAMRRELLLDPNKGSNLKVDDYSLDMDDTVTLGTSKSLSLSDSPSVYIRPMQLLTNAPVPGFVLIDEIKVANSSVTIGAGRTDAYNFSAQSNANKLSMPLIPPQTRVIIKGNYTGLTPSGYTATQPYVFTASFRGPGTVRL